MLVEETKFVNLFYFENSNVAKVHWKEASEDMSDNDFKDQIILEKEVLTKYRPQYLLGQTQSLKFTIDPDLQEWHNEQIMPLVSEIGIKKLAIVVSEDLFSEVSVNQLIDDDTKATYQTQYFSTEDDAMEWLAGSIGT